MKRVKLLHNDKAGDETHSGKQLTALIEGKGFICEYTSARHSYWKDINDETDFVAIAGGDGTVRKTVKKLLRRKLIDKKFPLAILPLGTANNLAKALFVSTDVRQAVSAWVQPAKKKFDIGRIYGLRERFFMESMGYGIFPRLMKKMAEREGKTEEAPEEELDVAIRILDTIIHSYQPKYCRLQVDGTDHSGNYLLAEIMNIRSIGPNLILAPDADSGDGLFEIVLITENQRDELASYLRSKLKGHEAPYNFDRLRGRTIKIQWEGDDGHVDDKLLKIKKPAEVKIEMAEGLLEFLVES